MADAIEKISQPKRRASPPGKTVRIRENQLIALTFDQAERQLRAGTASSQVMTHFLRLGSTLNDLEKERLRHENELLAARTASLKSAKDTEVLYREAVDAMRRYSGSHAEREEDD